MSKPPIYPEGYDDAALFDVYHCEGYRQVYGRALPDDWPYMLGLLTIIGDAVRGVPWGHPSQAVASPELPEVGSVWVARPGRSLASPHVTVMAVEPPVGVARARVGTVGPGREWASGPLGNFLHEHIPATVIPTPTADAWRSPADEMPPAEETIYAWAPGSGVRLHSLTPFDLADLRVLVADGVRKIDWLWQPVPPGVIPPPPADRDGGQ